MYEHHQFMVDTGQRACRLDKFLTERLPTLSRNKVQKGIKSGYVTVNGNKIKSNYQVQSGDKIIVSYDKEPETTDIIPENIPLSITYEDDELLIVNKPSGMVVHPACKNRTGTLVHALAYYLDNLPVRNGKPERLGLIHRIDKDTSGLLVVAKTKLSMQNLMKQFFDHAIERCYYALIWGVPKEDKGTINVNVGRSNKDRRITVAYPDGNFGKSAITHYEVLKNFTYVSLVKCTLETGRTHQIRSHMKYLGHPIFNDPMYGGAEIVKGEVFTKYKQFIQNCLSLLTGQALHAKTLGFKHPVTKEKIFVNSNLPDGFSRVLEKWERYILGR